MPRDSTMSTTRNFREPKEGRLGPGLLSANRRQCWPPKDAVHHATSDALADTKMHAWVTTGPGSTSSSPGPGLGAGAPWARAEWDQCDGVAPGSESPGAKP